MSLDNAKKVHFIGIGGISMSGLAEILKRDGYEVTGSDDVRSPVTVRLESVGIKVAVPNAAQNITDDVDMVVYTAAVKEDNPEFMAAVMKGKTLVERAALLGMILEGYNHAICVAGTHGKTTATSLMSEIVLDAGLDPTISIGGHMGRGGMNYRVGNSSYFVLEACEYSNSFHHWHPHVGIILNIDADHLDFFGDFDGVIKSFRRFAENIRPGGTLVILAGTPGFDKVVKDLPCHVVTFGESEGDFQVRNVTFDAMGRPTFDIVNGEAFLATVSLPLPGRYNMLNALATFAAAQALGIAPAVVAQALSNAKGVKRRFEDKGTYNGAQVIDDYAHHPTEIQACLAAARKGIENSKSAEGAQSKLVCLFQPHTYSRTKNLLSEFAESFGDADQVALLPIFASREAFDPTISSLDLAAGIKQAGGQVAHMQNFDEAVKFLQQTLMPGDLLITMGAGDVYFVGERLVLS
ncbi:MAG: UDP-N-acetylmuramate--L-alanine ligase [Defluviitaleaceae bacterium]|nr:UDP-N-acetylmuramate--L-alanine ligase [Defluviitaleaceae bacterium]